MVGRRRCAGQTSRLLIQLTLVLSLLTSLTPRVDAAASTAAPLALVPPVDQSRPAASYVATSSKAMIATAHPLASAAGHAMLQAGGNAVDAAVAAAFVISVVRPQSSGIGGGGFLLHYTAKKHQTTAYDFRERAPAAATAGMYLEPDGSLAKLKIDGTTLPDPSVNGHRSVAVPGLVKGLLQLHKKLGKLPLKQIMAPAIKIAAEGFPVYPGLATVLNERAFVLKHYDSSSRIFFRNGKPLVAGDLLVQKDLAWTLQKIAAEGEKVFYTGLIAKLIAAEMHRGGGLVTLDDLAKYRVKEPKPLLGTYRGYQLATFPPPSAGGVTILEILQILAADPNYHQLPASSGASLHLLTEAMRRAFADRMDIGDPAFIKMPIRGLISKAYGRLLHSQINPAKATPSSTVKPGQPAPYEHPSTTHLSVVDAQGDAVSTTQTVNYSFGSGVVAAGTGIVLNDEMDDFAKKPGAPNVFGVVGSEANAIAPGKTMVSSMSPTMVFNGDGSLRLVLGSPGGPRIITATLQTILHVLDHQMPLGTAVQSVRIHHQWLPDLLYTEAPGLGPEAAQTLTGLGHLVQQGGSIGDVQAVGLERGVLTGASDTRSEGAPLGL